LQCVNFVPYAGSCLAAFRADTLVPSSKMDRQPTYDVVFLCSYRYDDVLGESGGEEKAGL